MKALTCYQPWASLVALGIKTIETRSWATKYRGPLAIHAALSENWREGQQVGEWTCYRTSKTDQAHMYCRNHRPTAVPLPLVAIVATCTLVDVVPITDTTPVPHRPHVYVRDASAWLWRTVNEPGDISSQRPYGDFSPGRYAWLLADVEPVDPPVPWKGRQGLWSLPEGWLEAA